MIPRHCSPFSCLCAALILLHIALQSHGQTIPQDTSPRTIVISAAVETPSPAPANYTYDHADAVSPSGQTLGLNAEYLTLNGRPWLPVMGEIHYSRVPASEWETEILKMKSAGVQIISAYVIWIHHEEIEGQWDWSGQRDLRRFVQLCAKHGMYVVPRIGPWSHAEVRNGGFPDWLLAKTNQTRSNDPTYLKYVNLYYQQIAKQLQGLMWSEGGPVIAIQLENEYRGHGPGRGDEHILKLKELARSAGLRVPFYTVTGWDGASIPSGAVLPVYGGYAAAPWDASIGKLPPSEVYAFRFGSRVTGDMGAIGAPPRGNAANFTTDTPFMTAEMGGGNQATYHRRPVLSADDITAMMPVMLGSGVNLYGTYMFHGGENPEGKLTTLQESLATRYANDLPQKTYDFEAPIGEFGDERESLLKLKCWNYFLADFGSLLAPMQPRKPSVIPAGPRDLSVPRIAARTSGQSGFLFVNNHVREYSMPARPGFQVTINLPDNKSVTLPSQPITLPADAYFVWPFNLDLSGLHLRFATAQPLAILGTKESPVYAFFAQPGIDPEFVIDDQQGLKFDRENKSPYIQVVQKDGAFVLHKTGEKGEVSIAFKLPGGKTVTIVLLNQGGAEHSWKIPTGSRTQLFWTPQQAWVDGDTATLENLGEDSFLFDLTPGDKNVRSVDSTARILPLADGGYKASIQDKEAALLRLALTRIKPADSPAPLPDGFKPSSRPRAVAAAPTDANWSRAGIWSVTIPKSIAAAVESRGSSPASTSAQYFLRIHYSGDVARLSADGHLLDDEFSTGEPWLVGLTRFAPQLARSGGRLNLSVYPLRPDPPIFFEPGHEPKPGASVSSVELLTQYTLRLKLVPTKAATHKP